MPTSSYPAEEYTAVLDSLEKEVLSGCKRDGRIPIMGADINGSMGVYKKEEEESEGSDMLRSISPIGPYGIDKTNRNGQLFLSFLADNKLCSALTWSKGDFSTWRHPRYGEYHLDHLCVPRKMLNRVTKQGRYAYTETDHLGVTMDFRNEKKLLPKNLLEIQWEREEKKKEAEDIIQISRDQPVHTYLTR